LDFGLVLPSYRSGATTESIDAAAETAARLGWHSVFTTDHILVNPSARTEDYYNIFDALLTLPHVAARQPTLRIGISVLVVPQRNAVVLAKELATVDALSGGRLIVGVGVGWNEAEFGNVGADSLFHRRGAYLEEAIALWRHLWSGNQGAFDGRFHSFRDVRFGPLPPQGSNLPIWIGGRDEAALRRAGRLAQGYHATASGPAQLAVRVPVVRAAAEQAGRPAPRVSARVRVAFGPHEVPFYMLAGTPQQMIGEIHSFAEIGVDHLALDFGETDPEQLSRQMARFDDEVAAAVR
jgi:probable F420-dependent oxidoreductase